MSKFLYGTATIVLLMSVLFIGNLVCILSGDKDAIYTGIGGMISFIWCLFMLIRRLIRGKKNG